MESTIEEKLKALASLQEIDSKIDNIKSLRGELPMEVADLEDEIAGLETRINKLKDELEDTDKLIHQNKQRIKDAQAFIKKYEGQLDNVKNNREYEALSKEIEIQGLEIQAAEKRIREYQKGIEMKKGTITEAETELSGRKLDLENKKSELKVIIDETEKEEAQLMKEREKATKTIEERLITAYERIRSNVRNGIAVASIHRDSCSGCFGSIPPQMQADIRTRKKIIICEHCGRILTDASLLHVEVSS